MDISWLGVQAVWTPGWGDTVHEWPQKLALFDPSLHSVTTSGLQKTDVT